MNIEKQDIPKDDKSYWIIYGKPKGWNYKLQYQALIQYLFWEVDSSIDSYVLTFYKQIVNTAMLTIRDKAIILALRNPYKKCVFLLIFSLTSSKLRVISLKSLNFEPKIMLFRSENRLWTAVSPDLQWLYSVIWLNRKEGASWIYDTPS